jgi:hypothetical protein
MFFSNELQTRTAQDLLKLSCTFVAHAFVRGKLYSHFRSKSTFILPTSNRTWGNNVVYGSIFHIKDWNFYNRILDAYHTCSLSAIGDNHRLDIHHRVNTLATPIYFSSLNDFSRLLYREADDLPIQMYVGNLKHPKIKQRIKKSTHSYRLINGVDVENFKQCFREVST